MRANEYYDLLDNMREGYALLEVGCSRAQVRYNYRFLKVNRALEDMMGLSARNILGKSFVFLCKSERECLTDILDEVFRSGEPKQFSVVSKKFSRSFNVTSYAPTSNHLACIFTVKNNFLKNTAGQLKPEPCFANIDRLKADIMPHLDRELRAPLNVLLGSLGLLLEKQMDDELSELASQAYSSASRLSRFVDLFIDVFAPGARTATLDLSSFNLRKMVFGLVGSCNCGPQDNREVIFDIDKSVPEHVVGDSFRIQQVLEALIVSVQMISNGGPVRMEATVVDKICHDYHISFSFVYGARNVYNDCFEQGGVPINDLDIRFNRSGYSVGLGLAMCRKLVEVMRGSLFIGNLSSEGSVVRFSVPVQLPEMQFDSVNRLDVEKGSDEKIRHVISV